jgi:hypothetical protein
VPDSSGAVNVPATNIQSFQIKKRSMHAAPSIDVADQKRVKESVVNEVRQSAQLINDLDALRCSEVLTAAENRQNYVCGVLAGLIDETDRESTTRFYVSSSEAMNFISALTH